MSWSARSRRRSPASGWSRASARRSREVEPARGAARALFAPGCGWSGCRPSTPPRCRRSRRSARSACCCSAAGWRCRGDHLGTFLAFSTYLGQLVGPVRQVTALLTIGQQARAGVERVLEVDRLRARSSSSAGRGRRCRRARWASVRRRRVRLHPAPSRCCAACRCGSGRARRWRSSARRLGQVDLALLVPRFYDVHAGAVRDRRTRRPRRCDSPIAALGIGMVFEDSFLFSDTIAANIAYGRPGRQPRPRSRRPPGAAEAARLHRRAAGGLRHRGRRARPDPVRRPAAADRAGPGAADRPARAVSTTPPPRSTRVEAEILATLRAADGRPDHAADRAPPVHPGAGRPDRGAGRRPGRRRRHLRRAEARSPLFRLLLAGPARAGRRHGRGSRAAGPR